MWYQFCFCGYSLHTYLVSGYPWNNVILPPKDPSSCLPNQSVQIQSPHSAGLSWSPLCMDGLLIITDPSTDKRSSSVSLLDGHVNVLQFIITVTPSFAVKEPQQAPCRAASLLMRWRRPIISSGANPDEYVNHRVEWQWTWEVYGKLNAILDRFLGKTLLIAKESL